MHTAKIVDGCLENLASSGRQRVLPSYYYVGRRLPAKPRAVRVGRGKRVSRYKSRCARNNGKVYAMSKFRCGVAKFVNRLSALAVI